MKTTARFAASRLALAAAALLVSALAAATPYTPLAWQTVVERHADPSVVGQRKHTTWIRDGNRNFIDDDIERQFGPGDRVDIIVDLNRCLPAAEISETFSRYGAVAYVGKLITVALLDGVLVSNAALAAQPSVAMIEWRRNDIPDGRRLASGAGATEHGVFARDGRRCGPDRNGRDHCVDRYRRERRRRTARSSESSWPAMTRGTLPIRGTGCAIRATS